MRNISMATALIKRTSAILVIFLLVLILMSNSILVVSAEEIEQSNTYTLKLTISFADIEMGKENIDLLKANYFVIQEVQTQEYVQAVYNKEMKCFVFAGFSSTLNEPVSTLSNSAIASHLFAGMNAEDPNSLIVTNLPKGDYLIINSKHFCKKHLVYCRTDLRRRQRSLFF